ncbi:MAG: hypothetical protein D6708_03365 [Candidatus Dadabacteria bacterium]|nr:MAG: hypothetical protein D6708_03365 [Candidatus Dadabacteria bacterium]
MLRGWDPASAGERQLRLERRMDLASAAVRWALGLQIAGLAAFVFVADELHPLLTGAMCATGVLNADSLGWPALGVKLAAAAMAGVWLALDRIDRAVETQPMTRAKAALLLGIVPLVALDLGLTLGFFGRLDPQVITSCCGALFSADGSGPAADLASVEPRTGLAVLFGAGALHGAAGLWALRSRGERVWGLLAVTAAGLGLAGAAGIVSAVGPYVYELPSHRCPFDLLQSGYGFVGYPLYLSLGGAVYCGVLPALLGFARNRGGAAAVVGRYRARWARWSVGWALAFVALCAWLVARSGLRLIG